MARFLCFNYGMKTLSKWVCGRFFANPTIKPVWKPFVFEGTIYYPGESIRVRRTKFWGLVSYDHVGICLGNGVVSDYHGENKKDAAIRLVSMDMFAGDGQVEKVPYPEGECLPPYETVARALGDVGSDLGGYSLPVNNCEHRANWCKTGKWESRQVKQVEKFLITVSIITAAVAVAVAGVYYIHKNKR